MPGDGGPVCRAREGVAGFNIGVSCKGTRRGEGYAARKKERPAGEDVGAEIFGTKIRKNFHLPRWAGLLPNVDAENFGTKICRAAYVKWL